MNMPNKLKNISNIPKTFEATFDPIKEFTLIFPDGDKIKFIGSMDKNGKITSKDGEYVMYTTDEDIASFIASGNSINSITKNPHEVSICTSGMPEIKEVESMLVNKKED